MREIRINKVLRELNISLDKAINILNNFGIEIEKSPNAKISESEYIILCNNSNNNKLKPSEIIELEKIYGIILFELPRNSKISTNNSFELDENGKIEKLILHSNNIKTIKGLDNFRDLKILDLSNNSIDKIEGLESLVKLECIYLSKNNIYKIENLENLTNLKSLIIPQNKIEKIEGLLSNEFIGKLNLSHNNISKIEGFDNLLELEDLLLNNNQITKIQGLNNNINLKNLNLNRNKIHKIENLDGLKNLKTLYLNENGIIKIEGLTNLTNLERIYLSNNNINKVEGFDNLFKLNSIDLSFCKISEIDEKIFNKFNLIYFDNLNIKKGINLFKNPLDPTIINILLNENEDESKIRLSEYFNRKQLADTTEINRVKIVLLGNTGVGKTTFADFFSNNKKANGDSTHGINFFDFKISQNKNKEIEVKGYDFGGQDYYHNTHHTFFDDTAIYLIIWGNGQSDIIDLNNKNEITFPLNYWLGSLNKFASKNFLNNYYKIFNFSNFENINHEEKKELKNIPAKSFYPNEDLDIAEDLTLYDFINETIKNIDSQIKSPNINYRDIKSKIKNIGFKNLNIDILSDKFKNETKESIEYYNNYYSSLIKNYDFTFQTFVVQNINENFDMKRLNEQALIDEYSFIKDFRSLNFKNQKEVAELKNWLEKVINNFSIPRKILTIDLELTKKFEDKIIKNKVILNLEDIKKLQKNISNFTVKNLNSLLRDLHNIFACYYFEIEDITKKQLENKDLEDIVIIDIEKFTDWIYLILNKKDLLENKNGYFKIDDAVKWLEDEELAIKNIYYLIAFMLQNKLIFKMHGSDEHFFSPNYLNNYQTKTEELFLKSFESPLVKYEFEEFFHTSLLSEIISKFYSHLILETKTKEKWEYVLWKNKVILYEEINTDKLIYINFEINKDTKPTISVCKYNKKVGDDFILKVINFIEEEINIYTYKKLILTPKGSFIPFSCLTESNITENQEKTNLFIFNNTVYKKSDFKLFLKNKDDYPMKKIFISYSKYDEDYKEEFKKHTRTLQEEGLIDKPFDCGAIDLGAEWDTTIQSAIDDCDIMVCLVSVDFLNTDYIRKYEVKKAIEKNKILIPIIIKPCDWESSDFGKFQAALRGKKISLNYEEELKNIVKENSTIEKAAFWTKVIKEFRLKIFN